MKFKPTLSRVAFAVGQVLHDRLFAHMARSGLVLGLDDVDTATAKALDRIRVEVKDKLAEQAAEIIAIQQKMVKSPLGGPGNIGAGAGSPDQFGQAVEAEFRAQEAAFKSSGRINLSVKTITGAVVGAHTSVDAPNAPGIPPSSLISIIGSQSIDGVQTLHYPRLTSTIAGAGLADVQAGEGATKATVEPVFTAEVQSAATIAGLAAMSMQALLTSGNLQRVVSSFLTRAIRVATDKLLVSGTTESSCPFAGLLALADHSYSTGARSLLDSILSGRLELIDRGYAPSVVVVSKHDFFELTIAKDSQGRYLQNYPSAASLALSAAGLRVALNPGITAGSAVVLDPQYFYALTDPATQIQLGIINDDFARNLVRIRGEIRVIPVFTDVNAAIVVDPSS
jgi:HK97 family phage major capsid protein